MESNNRREHLMGAASANGSAYNHNHHHHLHHLGAAMGPSNFASSLLSAPLVTSSSSSSGGFFCNSNDGGNSNNTDNMGCNSFGRKIGKRRRSGLDGYNIMKSGTTAGGDSYDDDDEDDHDTVLARELNELSFEERNKVYEEVHGVAQLPQESDTFIQSCLDNLKDEIAKLARYKRKALDKAFFMKPTLSTDTKFMKMFLRADCYDCKKAANRMAKYFQYKAELWGESKLVKDLTLDDLSEDDMDSMNSGCCHILTEKDRSGRTTMFVSQRHVRFKHWTNHVRYIWYQLMSALEDEETQIRGLVNVLHCVGIEYMDGHRPPLIPEGNVLNELPFRIAGFHFCYSDSRFKAALSLAQVVFAQQTRLRFRSHCGSNVETQYALLSFGIPMHAIPISDDGELNTEMNQLYISERKSIESMREKVRYQRRQSGGESDLFDYPSPNDVLLGRGRPFQDYRGNQQLVEIVEGQRSKYQALTDKFEKTCITMTIVNKIKNDLGGRFMQRTNDGWKEVGDVAAREKISHTFRTKTNKSKVNNNNSIQSPTTPMATTDVVGSSTNIYGNQNKRIRLHVDNDGNPTNNWNGYFAM